MWLIEKEISTEHQQFKCDGIIGNTNNAKIKSIGNRTNFSNQVDFSKLSGFFSQKHNLQV